MINLSTMAQTDIIKAVESRDKIKELITIVEAIPSSKKGNSFVNHDAIMAIKKILEVQGSWDIIGDRTHLKRELRKRNFTI